MLNHIVPHRLVSELELGCQATHQSTKRAASTKLTRLDDAQQECPCCKKAWQSEGENKPYFSIFHIQTETNGSDRPYRPRVWLTWLLWLARCHPAMSRGAADGRSSWQWPELPCSSQLSPCYYFHTGAPPHTGAEQGGAEVVFLPISISQREIQDDRCVNGSS